jgi:hypothetical protein
MILLPLPPEWLGLQHVPPYLASTILFDHLLGPHAEDVAVSKTDKVSVVELKAEHRRRQIKKQEQHLVAKAVCTGLG